MTEHLSFNGQFSVSKHKNPVLLLCGHGNSDSPNQAATKQMPGIEPIKRFPVTTNMVNRPRPRTSKSTKNSTTIAASLFLLENEVTLVICLLVSTIL
jgi:hypothetical protein